MNDLDDLKKNQEKLRKHRKALLSIIEEGEAKGQEFQGAINLAREQLGKIERFLNATNAENN